MTIKFENQGIFDGRPAGTRLSLRIDVTDVVLGQSQPPGPVTFDQVVDEDVSAPPPSAEETLVGPTSQDVHQGMGVPVYGMSSKEIRHNGLPKRKKERSDVDQFGPPGEKAKVMDRAERDAEKAKNLAGVEPV